MAEFERTALVSADPKAVFGVLANPRVTASWSHGRLPLQTEGEGTGGADGTHEAVLSTSPEQMRVEWTSPSRGYAGWAQVSERRGMGAEVTIHLSLTGDLEPGSSQDAERVIEELDSALDGLCVRMEGGGS